MADDLPPSQHRTSKKSGALTDPEDIGPPRPVVGDLDPLLCYSGFIPPYKPVVYKEETRSVPVHVSQTSRKNGSISSISALHQGEWSTSRCGSFTLVEKVLGTYRVEHYVGSKFCLEDLENRKISCPYRELKHKSLDTYISYNMKYFPKCFSSFQPLTCEVIYFLVPCI